MPGHAEHAARDSAEAAWPLGLRGTWGAQGTLAVTEVNKEESCSLPPLQNTMTPPTILQPTPHAPTALGSSFLF